MLWQAPERGAPAIECGSLVGVRAADVNDDLVARVQTERVEQPGVEHKVGPRRVDDALVG